MESKTLKKGLFITFEGPEGSGKSTQISLLKDYLEKNGYTVTLTREPGGTLISEKIRKLLLSPENKNMLPKTELFLYAASRIQHIGEIIKPALNDGKLVISDRFHDSTTAYQGYARGLSLEYIEKVHKLVLDEVKPDITFILLVDIKRGIARARKESEKKQDSFKGGDRLEQEALEFHQRVYEGYKEIAKKNQERVILLEEDTIENIHKKIVAVIEKRLEELCE